MKVGDYVKVENQHLLFPTGFIADKKYHRLNECMIYYVINSYNGKGHWFHPEKLEVISEG